LSLRAAAGIGEANLGAGKPVSEAELDLRLSGRRLALVRAAWLAIALFSFIILVAGLYLNYAELQAPCRSSVEDCLGAGRLPADRIPALENLGFSPRSWALYFILLYAISSGVWFGAGVLIFARKSDHAMALLIALFLVTFGVTFSEPPDTLAQAAPDWWLPVQSIAFVGNVCSGLFAYLFPSGRFVPRWTRWLAIAWIALSIPEYFFSDSQLNYQNHGEAISIPIFVGFLLSFVGAQVLRYRRVSTPAQRRQTRWIVMGMSVAIVGFLAPILTAIFIPPLERSVLAWTLLITMINGSLMLIPLSFSIAILHSRLWDVDAIIRRALVYGALSVLLAGVYFGSVVLLQAIFNRATGQESQFTIVLSTLAIAALFSPLRRRVQAAIDRRFYRRKYDAEQTLAAFSASLREEVDLNQLAGRLTGAVESTLQPESVSLWLRQIHS
jgi:hypothetical protein